MTPQTPPPTHAPGDDHAPDPGDGRKAERPGPPEGPTAQRPPSSAAQSDAPITVVTEPKTSRRDRRKQRRRARAVDRPGMTKRRDEPVFGVVLFIVAALLTLLMAVGLTSAPIRPGTPEAAQLNHSAENWQRLHTQTTTPANTAPGVAAPQDMPQSESLDPLDSPQPISLSEINDEPEQLATEDLDTQQTQQETASEDIPFIFVPFSHQEPLTTAPPAMAWLHRFVFDGVGFYLGETYIGLPPLDPTNTHPDQLAQRARWLSVTLAILGVGLIGWAGFCVGRLVTGALALIVAATCPAVIWHSSFATDDAAKLACLGFTAATGVWAMRPLRPNPILPRQIAGWLGCGLGLGISVLVGGPALGLLALVLVLVPLVICPSRASHTVGLFAAVAVAGLCMVPWLLASYTLSETAGQAWLHAWVPDPKAIVRSASQAFGEGLWMGALLMAPWVLWLIAAMGQAASSSSRELRGRVLIGVGWFWGSLLVIGLTTPNQTPSERTMLMWPAIALLIAQGFRRFNELSSEGRHARLWLLLRWVHLPAMIAGAALLGIVCYQPDWFVQINPTVTKWVKPTHAGHAIAGAVMALLVATIAARYVTGNHPGRMLATYAAYLYIGMIVLAGPVSQSPAMLNLKPSPALPQNPPSNTPHPAESSNAPPAPAASGIDS